MISIFVSVSMKLITFLWNKHLFAKNMYKIHLWPGAFLCTTVEVTSGNIARASGQERAGQGHCSVL